MIDETGRSIPPSRLEVMALLKAQHEEAWGVAISPYTPPFSYLTWEEIWAVCERARACPPGCFVEVGVYKGGSAYHLIDVARIQGRQVWLYDTFEGMAYEDPVDTIHVGEIKAEEAAARSALGDYATIVKCVFPVTQTLPSEPVAFAHIDCDQYRAIIETCGALEPLMAKGGQMLFDDVPVLAGARKAVTELYGDRIEKVEHGRWAVRF